MTNILIKKCTADDVDLAVPLIYSSGPDGFQYVFSNNKKTAIDFLRYAFQQAGGEFSYDNHFGVYQDEQLIGIGAVFNGKKANGFLTKDFINILKVYRLAAAPTLVKGLRTEQIIKPPKSNEIAIAHLGITEQYRSRGLGEKLISYLIAEAQTSASDTFVLDVSEENPRARLLYERLGWQVTKHNPSNLRNRISYVPNHFRMEYVAQ